MAVLCTISYGVLALIFLPYILHHALLGLCKDRDLKKRYNAQWALVTGASSGERLGSHNYKRSHTCAAVSFSKSSAKP